MTLKQEAADRPCLDQPCTPCFYYFVLFSFFTSFIYQFTNWSESFWRLKRANSGIWGVGMATECNFSFLSYLLVSIHDLETVSYLKIMMSLVRFLHFIMYSQTVSLVI